MIGYLPRGEAVDTIAGCLADRTGFVVVVPRALVPTLADRLPDLPGEWTGYLDNGTDTVLATGDAAAIQVTSLLVGERVNGVVVVPKSVPAVTLGAALGQQVAEDGSQDILVLTDQASRWAEWPALFLDALAVVDPKAAAQIRASDLVSQS